MAAYVVKIAPDRMLGIGQVSLQVILMYEV